MTAQAPRDAIDLHGHFTVEALLRHGSANDEWRYIAVRNPGEIVYFTRDTDVVPCKYEPLDAGAIVENMNRLGIDKMAINVAPYQLHYNVSAPAGVEIARLGNEAIANVVEAHPDRFLGLGTLPLQAPKAALAEFESLMKRPGFVGVELGSNVNGAYLGERQFWPLWEAVADAGALVFIHPLNVIGADRLDKYFLANVIGNPIETTRCIADLIFSGLLEQFGDLKICVAHAGGVAPWLAGRWSRGFDVREGPRTNIRRDPIEYLKLLYFDHITHSERALRYLVDMVGLDHVVLGSDYPFDMGPDEPVGWLDNASTLSADEKAAIRSGNARRLLNLSGQE
jgi:aminocarboxymuconate-semialdehyde decarboxylase